MPIPYINQDPSWQNQQFTWAGPYMVTQFHRPNAVYLNLLAKVAIHYILNISSLKMCNLNQTQEKSAPPPPFQTVCYSDGMIYSVHVVEATTSHMWVLDIISCYKNQVNWENFNYIMTLEPATTFSNLKQILDDYKVQYRLGEVKVKWKSKG